jgi:hypothetical protein
MLSNKTYNSIDKNNIIMDEKIINLTDVILFDLFTQVTIIIQLGERLIKKFRWFKE